jgi:hypothetical protein
MRILAAMALATAALAAPTAAWAYGSEVGAYNCAANGGQVTRPAGTEIVVRQGWATATAGQSRQFINAQSTTISVNSGPTVDLSRDWTTPRQVSDGTWRTDVFYPTGIVLGPGQSLTFHFLNTVNHRIFDGFSYGGPGTLIDSTCTVTGA